jgi:hypothetical protein
MFRIRVERLIRKDIDSVFDVLSDHGNYRRFPGIERSVLLEPGKPEENGEGALRCLGSGPVEFYERITRYERPTRFDYLIERSKPLPFKHEKGTLLFVPEGGSTRVVWTSEGHIDVPLLGKLVFDRLVERRGTLLFGRLLEYVDGA